MKKQFLKDGVMWGLLLWLIGYALGIILFPFVPSTMIGWIITPFGVLPTCLVLLKKVKGNSLSYYAGIGLLWVAIAVLCDYFLLYKAFKPADGYYKLDVYFYYTVTFLLPLLIGWWKTKKKA